MAQNQSYHHLDALERGWIAHWLATEMPLQEIARALGRSVRTISAEIKRNSCGGVYLACDAQQLAERRRHEARAKSAKMKRPEIREFVTAKLRLRWSPDQIAGRLKREFPHDPRRRISAPTIYHWLATDDHGASWSRLLRGRKRRKPRAISPEKQHCAIAGRPEIVNARERVGDWEGDTIVGWGGRASLVSLVERVSGYAELIAVENRLSATVIGAVQRRLRPLPPETRKTLTFDNGSEFANYAELTAGLGLDIYFAAPHCPWQRGSNEHFNRLVRDFFPKGTDLRGLNRRKLAEVQRLLNQRPRKRLEYQTPDEFLAETCRRTLDT